MNSPLSQKESSQKKYKFNGKYYTVVERLGKGTYGSVFRAKFTSKFTSEEVAIKKIKLDVDSEGIPSTTLREIAILKSLNHPNIVKLLDYSLHNSKILLCLEFLDHDLKKFMEIHSKKDSLKPDLVKSIMFQILKAVDHMHSSRMLHRDLKPQNVLIDKDLNVKLADFGLGRSYNIPIRPYTKEVLTLWYRAPELIYGIECYSTGIDMWSLGCIFAELFLKKPLFCGQSEIDQLFKICEILGSPTEETLPGYSTFPHFQKTFPMWQTKTGLKEKLKCTGIDSKGLDLLSKLLTFNPIQRINARDACRHEYFKGVFVPKKK